MELEEFDVVIVGGGPAALAAAIYTARGELKTVILERSALGGQVALTDAIDNYAGFPEGVSGPELIERMTAQVRRFGAEMRVGEEVRKIELEGVMRVVRTAGHAYRAPVVILAMGADARKLGVPGERELRGRGVSYCGTCDAPFFKEKRVVVVGGGDAAFKEGLFIAKFAREVVLVHRRQGFRAERIYQREAEGHPKFTFVLDTVVEEILGEQKVEGVAVRNVKTAEKRRIECDGVFIFIGHEPNTAFLEGLGCLEPNRQVKTDEHMMSCVPGIFAVGDVREGSMRQIATAVGEAATAAISAEHYIGDLRVGGRL